MSNGSKESDISPAVRARLQKCFEYGNQKMQMGEYDYASEMFIQCVLGDPQNIIYLQTFIGNLRVKYGNNKKGASFGFLKGGGSKSKIKAAEVSKNWPGVLKAGYESLKTNPWDSATYVSMAKASLELEYDELALALFKHAIECSPDDAEINRLAARELDRQEKYPDAIACWQRLLKAKPNDLEAGKNISDLMLKMQLQKMQTAEKASQEVKTESPKLSFDDECEKRLKKNPHDHDTYLDLAEYYVRNRKYRKAEDVFRRALMEFENDEVFELRQLEVQKIHAEEDMHQAKKLYEQDSSEELKAKFLQQKQAYEQKSLELMKSRMRREPGNTSLRFEYGNFLVQHGHFKEAISEFQLAKADQALVGPCLLLLAQCFQQIKQYKLAMTHYTQAVQALSENSDLLKKALYLATRLAAYLKEYDVAETFANQLAAIDFSYKDIGDLLDKIANLRHNS